MPSDDPTTPDSSHLNLQRTDPQLRTRASKRLQEQLAEQLNSLFPRGTSAISMLLRGGLPQIVQEIVCLQTQNSAQGGDATSNIQKHQFCSELRPF